MADTESPNRKSKTMPADRTPQSITDKILNFSEELGGLQTPQFLTIEPTGEPEICHLNVQNKIAEFGGKNIYGRAIWIFPKYWLMGQFHSVWEDGDGKWHDITPDADDETRRLFVPTNGSFDEYALPNVWKPLTDNPDIVQCCKYHRKADELRCKYKYGEPVSGDDTKEMLHLKLQANLLLAKASAPETKPTGPSRDARRKKRKAERQRKKKKR